VIASTDKPGRSGPLTFVTVGQQVSQRDELVVDERQEIVYREPGAQAPPPEAPEQPAGEDEWAIEISPTLLFRFSALTYNGHRIHYDRDYARDVEGYPGLVTHGPLQALAMAEHARARGVSATRCEFRLIAPLFEHQGLIAGADYVRDRGGRRTAQGTVA